MGSEVDQRRQPAAAQSEHEDSGVRQLARRDVRIQIERERHQQHRPQKPEDEAEQAQATIMWAFGIALALAALIVVPTTLA